MPVYEFVCGACGPFEEYRSLAGAGARAICPACQGRARRIYSVPGLIRTPSSLRRRIERGAEPTLVRRELKTSDPASGVKDRQYQSRGRPWQTSHGGRSDPPANPKTRSI